MRTKLIVAAVLLIGVYFVFPFEVVIAPAWTVKVVDQDGRPLEGGVVYESWQHYSVEDNGSEERKTTGKTGTVTFPERRKRVVRFIGWLGNVENALKYGVHASFGPHSHVGAFKSGYGNIVVSNYRDDSWSGGSTRPKETIQTLILCSPGEKRGGCDLESLMHSEGKGTPK